MFILHCFNFQPYSKFLLLSIGSLTNNTQNWSLLLHIALLNDSQFSLEPPKLFRYWFIKSLLYCLFFWNSCRFWMYTEECSHKIRRNLRAIRVLSFSTPIKTFKILVKYIFTPVGFHFYYIFTQIDKVHKQLFRCALCTTKQQGMVIQTIKLSDFLFPRYQTTYKQCIYCRVRFAVL